MSNNAKHPPKKQKQGHGFNIAAFFFLGVSAVIAILAAPGLTAVRVVAIALFAGTSFSIAAVYAAIDLGIFRGISTVDIVPRLMVIFAVSWTAPVLVCSLFWPAPLGDEPEERGFPSVSAIMLHTQIGDTYAVVTLKNIGRYRIYSAIVRGAIIASRPLMPAEETANLFSGQENGQHGGLVTLPGSYWDPGDTKQITIKNDPIFGPQEWQDIGDCDKRRGCKKIIYVVTKTFGSDKFGSFSPKESCWYVSALDLDHARKCFGHND